MILCTMNIVICRKKDIRAKIIASYDTRSAIGREIDIILQTYGLHWQGSYTPCLMFCPDFFLENEDSFADNRSETHNIFPDQLELQMMLATDSSFENK